MTREEQEKCFEENKGLIYFVLNKYGYNSSNPIFEDCYQVASIGMWNGILTYNPKYNINLSTYLTTCARNELLRYLKTVNKKVVHEPLGLEDLKSIGKRKDKKDNAIDYIKDESYAHKEEFRRCFEEYKEKVRQNVVENKNGTGKKMFLDYLDGIGISEIAEKYNCSRQYVSKTIQRLANQTEYNYRQCFFGEGVK